ncbi:N-acetylneuraminate synthase family protein [Mucilaginibacter sp. UC70_90]
MQITELHLGVKDKVAVFKEICSRLNISANEIAFIGDDYNDLEVMKLAGLTASPADALPHVKTRVDFVSSLNGGDGCFREFAELIIEAKSDKYLSGTRNGTVTLQNGRAIGKGQPSYIIAEIGINHNGSLEICKKLIDEAVAAKADAVKFQKRTPEICVPRDQWEIMRDTPWGRITYIDYKRKTEFGIAEYATIDQYCKKVGIDWFVSAWDAPSVDFMEQFDTILYKLASASLTDFAFDPAHIGNR